ncbi:hypothetical protein [Aureimonas sp. AU4]|uniref:hypothetical protein n=1 Tax=Aureimonas sp. AU4 TaxID=1638163 RepID=UPI000780EE20|nr:hypothetical protein [Aureimonas sp. AU4]
MNLPRDRYGCIRRPPTYAEAEAVRPPVDVSAEGDAVTALRIHLEAFERRFGRGTLISLLKIEMIYRGEDARKLDAAAHKFGPGAIASPSNGG